MAFSYSDKNFTVVGNLCFVHIVLDGTQTTYYIPPAISDRMLFSNISFVYTYHVKNNVSRGGSVRPNFGYGEVYSDVIVCSDAGNGYLSFYFPIDSNK